MVEVRPGGGRVIHGARLLLLAAGRGKRSGGPKAWKDHRGKPLLEAHLDFFREKLSGPESVSVSIQPEWLERCNALSPKTVWVVSEPDAPPMESLKRLVKLSPPARSFVLHVDMPVFDEAVFRALWDAKAEIAVPVFEGRRGHPVLLAPAALDKLAGLDPKTDRLDAWLRSQSVAEVPVASELILANENG